MVWGEEGIEDESPMMGEGVGLLFDLGAGGEGNGHKLLIGAVSLGIAEELDELFVGQIHHIIQI